MNAFPNKPETLKEKPCEKKNKQKSKSILRTKRKHNVEQIYDMPNQPLQACKYCNRETSYPMKDRRLDFFGFFSGNSLIRCMDNLRPECEFRLGGATLSEFLLPTVCDPSSSLPPPDFLMKGRFVDSLSDRGFLTACTSSFTELVAMSF